MGLSYVLFLCLSVTTATTSTIFTNDMTTINSTIWVSTVGVVGISTDNECPTNPCTELQGNLANDYSSITSAPISTINFHNISLQYDAQVNLVESADICYIQYSINNGINWTDVAFYGDADDGTTYRNQIKKLNSTTSNINNLQLQIYFVASHSNDHCHISNIILCGEPVPTTISPTSDTAVPTTNIPTTTIPTSTHPTTSSPTFLPTTSEPTIDSVTTNMPTTNMPTTDMPTTNMPTTAVPTTNMPT
eukprot:91827_1